MTLRIAALVFCVTSLAGCGEPPAKTSHKSPPPARITNGRPEASATLVTLTPRAVERIGIKTVAVKRRATPHWRSLPGRIEVRPGARIDVVAPVAGLLSIPPGGKLVTALDRVETGDVLATLTPMLTPDRQVLTEPERTAVAMHRADLKVRLRDAQTAIEIARARSEGAASVLARAEKLVGQSVSERELDELRTLHATASVALREAERKREIVAEIDLEHPAEKLTDVLIRAGRAGLIEEARVAEGQFVTPGAVIATILDDAEFLLTVPVYVGELPELAPDRGARAARLGGGDEVALKPAMGFPRGDPIAATVHLHFALDNADRRWSLGERLSVSLRTTGEEEALVVPWSAVHYDFNGGAWVYVAESQVDFRRARVEVSRRDGEAAVLHLGPAPGTQIVSVGAVELFGTEFGTGK